jgi:hypothetical protein
MQRTARQSDTTIEIIELRPQEVQLIKALRNSLRFGEVTIKVRDGLPFRLVRIQEFVDLGNALDKNGEDVL